MPRNLRGSVLQVLAVVLLSLSAVIPDTLHAQKPIDVGSAVPPGTVTHVRLQSGSVTLTGWSHDSVHVRGALAPGESWVMRADGDTMRLRAEGIPRGLAAPSELEIFVPMSSALVVRAAAASLVVSDFDAPVDVATAAGNLLVELVRASVRAETMQGTLTVMGPIPRVEASTASGALLVSVPYDTVNDEVFARRISGDAANVAPTFGTVILRSVSGRITFDAPRVDSASIHAVRGDVRVVTSTSASGAVRVTSHVGRVTVGWSDAMSGVYDVRSMRGGLRGRVPTRAVTRGAPSDVDVTALMTRADSLAGVVLRHAFGADSALRGTVRVQSVRGDIVFERAQTKSAP